MAYPTAEQIDAERQLVAEYGDPLTRSIEHTPTTYGIVALEFALEHAGLGRRRLFIRPDGTRLSWRELQ